MSLVQHVHPLEGTDREEALVDLFLPPLERVASIDRASERRFSLESGFSGPPKSIRRIISYDALKPPEETTEEYGGVTQYHVTTAMRLGKPAFPLWQLPPSVLTSYSPSYYYSPGVLVREWHCFRLRCPQAYSHQRRRLQRSLPPR